MILIERFQLGDEYAMHQIAARYMTRAYHHAKRLRMSMPILPHFDEGDIVGETFLKVRRSLSRFKGQCSFATWLFRVETNCFLDMIRRNNASPRTLSFDSLQILPDREREGGFEAVQPGPTPFDLAAHEERLRTVHAVVNRLSSRQQEVVKQFYEELLTYREISHLHDLPIGTIKSRLHRARRALRAAVTDDPLSATTKPKARRL